jgi:hypothetical protein
MDDSSSSDISKLAKDKVKFSNGEEVDDDPEFKEKPQFPAQKTLKDKTSGTITPSNNLKG